MNGKTEYWGNNYGYDAWGNLTGKSITKCGAELLNAPALVNNQLSGYGYDAAGNMTSDPADNVSSTYDAENRIASASTASGTFTYTYDSDGNRVKKSGGGSGTLYWYMAAGIVAESDLSGNLKSEYVFFNGERVARKDFDTSPHAATGVFYYFSDHLKTASVITDSLGNIKSESDYYPWGGDLQFVNSDSNHYKFTGKERDSESGLDYFGARYYSNGLGRFITPDWAAKATAVPYAEFDDPQSLNLYTYVRNIPTAGLDVDGHIDDNADPDHPIMASCGFFCKLGNFFKYGHFVDDAHLEAALQKDAQNDIADLTKRGIIINGKSPADAFKGMTNQQIIDAYRNINSQLDVQDTFGQSAAIPAAAINTLNSIDKTGSAPQGQRGGNQFMNDGRGDGQVLPRADANGNAVTYREWDINSKPSSGTRGAERLVAGSDGSAYS